MKKRILILLALFIFVSALTGTYRWKGNFLATAEDVGSGATAVNVTHFDSAEIWVAKRGWPNICSITVTFTRAAGSASTVDFAFEASFDGGNTWATFEGVTISVATNHSVISGTTVRVLTLVNIPGVSHIRLKSIKNNDGANNLTACNATLTI